jgi:major vault protein
MTEIISLKPLQYIHVLDDNSNLTRVVCGPMTFTPLQHEKIVLKPQPMIIIPPRNYAKIANPVVVDPQTKKPIMDENGQYKLRLGDEEIRLGPMDPFPLYPGEEIVGKVLPLAIVKPLTALKIEVIRDTENYKAGEMYIFPGPNTYIPKVGEKIVEIVKAEIVLPNHALKLRATRSCKDSEGKERRAGEEWLHFKQGPYIPGVYEVVVNVVKPYILNDSIALRVEALQTFTQGKIQRKAGTEWLVTSKDTESYIPGVYETVKDTVRAQVLSKRQYCVVLNPINEKGERLIGKRELRRGPLTFFLQPQETLENGIQDIHVLIEGEALLLRAKQAFQDGNVKRNPGDLWMVDGPTEYIPPIQVEVIKKRKAIPLDKNEGIYVRDTLKGTVSLITGCTYSLKPHEELWKKELPPEVEKLLSGEGGKARNKSRAVSFRAPHNTCVQLYDYKANTSRLVWGPALVMLEPDEQITVLSLSGGKPKRPHMIKALWLQLGPEYMTDIFVVETSDHAKLSLKLSYNWHLKVSPTDQDAAKIFSVPDFVGDACKAIASRVRSAVAQATFDHFHKFSAKEIRQAVFGATDGKVNDEYYFPENKLTITNIDIQSVEPVDAKTRDSLVKSVQLAIEITTKSQEANARQEAKREEQQAKGELDIQKLKDDQEAEKLRQQFIQLETKTKIVEQAGEATANAQAEAKAKEIEAQTAVQKSSFEAQANKIRHQAIIAMKKKRQEAKLRHQESLDDIELGKSEALAKIETEKFGNIVKSIGPQTIQAIAQAGPELQAKLLQSLGIKSLMITDGKSPINLFSTANGLIGGSK